MTHIMQWRILGSRVLPGVVRYTFIIFGLFTNPNLCPLHKILATPLNGWDQRIKPIASYKRAQSLHGSLSLGRKKNYTRIRADISSAPFLRSFCSWNLSNLIIRLSDTATFLSRSSLIRIITNLFQQLFLIMISYRATTRARPELRQPFTGALSLRNLHLHQCLYSSVFTKNCKQNWHGTKSSTSELLQLCRLTSTSPKLNYKLYFWQVLVFHPILLKSKVFTHFISVL